MNCSDFKQVYIGWFGKKQSHSVVFKYALHCIPGVTQPQRVTAVTSQVFQSFAWVPLKQRIVSPVIKLEFYLEMPISGKKV